MRKIAYTKANGGVSIVHPCEGARLVSALFINGVRRECAEPMPADTIFQVWPVKDVTAEWAETEDEFLARVFAKVVPAGAKDARIVDEIPSDRSSRATWRIDGSSVKSKE